MDDIFSQQPNFSFDDLINEEMDKANIGNTPSKSNLAAVASVINGDPSEISVKYQQVKAEMDELGQSPTADSIIEAAQQKAFNQSRGQFIEYLNDPTKSDEDKQRLISNYYDVKNEQYSLHKMLFNEALIADSGNESPENEFVRVSLLDIANDYFDYRDEAQKALNHEVASRDINYLNDFADIFEYLVPFTEGVYTGKILDDMRNGDGNSYLQSVIALGESKKDIAQIIASVPVSERSGMIEKLLKAVNNHPGMVLPGSNDFAKIQLLKSMLDDGGYTDTERWIDNATSALDILGIGGGVRALARTAKAEYFINKIKSAVRKQFVKSRVNPASVSQAFADTNPAKANAAHVAMLTDQSDETAMALYGTTKQDAIAHDLLPEIGDDGVVVSKANIPTDADEVIRMVNIEYASGVDPIEYFSAAYNKNLELASVRGLTARPNMFQVQSSDTGTMIKAVYGPPQGGWSNPQAALDSAKMAMLKYGIDDSAIKLIRREGTHYVPTTIDEIKALTKVKQMPVKWKRGKGGKQLYQTVYSKPDYLVTVDYNYKFNPSDVTEWADYTVKNNFIDRIGAFTGKSGQGSLNAMLVDPHSMLDPHITLGANAVVDRSSAMDRQLLDLAKPFADGMKALDDDRRALVNSVIFEANSRSKWPTDNALIAAGFTENEVGMLNKWKEFWDTMHYVENSDLAKTLSSRGYMSYVNHDAGTNLIAKPYKRGAIGNKATVYDAQTGTSRVYSKDELDQLYESGGTIAKLRIPMHDDTGELVDFIASPNVPGNYMQEINSWTKVLNYREGYYPVKYKDPIFIIKKYITDDGVHKPEFDRAVATSGSIKDADVMMDNLRATKGGDYYRREDIKRADIDSDVYWQLQYASGRSAQKLRGQRLGFEGSEILDGSEAAILSPVDALIGSVRSISARSSMRDYLEVTKSRFMEKYKAYLPTERGEPLFPSNVKEVMYRGGQNQNAKELGDAITTYNYIHYLEDGYINSIDDFYKRAFLGLSNIAGERGFVTLEKVARRASETRGPSAMGKNVAFNAYLATNPFRQFVVQSHQAVQLAANFGDYIASGRMVPEVLILSLKQMGYEVPDAVLAGARLTRSQADEMFKEFTRSGLVASIDRQNLVRGSLASLADEYSHRDIKPLTMLRKVGFDAGENVNMMSAWLAHRYRAAKNGQPLNAKTYSDVAARARNYTYNMNQAGDMPYNQNALALLFQFQQVPHKAFTQMFGNRVLTAAEKRRLMAWNGIMYTLPPATMYAIASKTGMLTDDPETNDLIVYGMESAIFNKLLSLTNDGVNPRIDFSGLAPTDLHGTYNLILSIWTDGIGNALANTPAAQMLIGNNPRITNFLKTTARYFHVIDDYESNPTQLAAVIKDFASISSGFSNAYKAAAMQYYGRKMSQYGDVTVEDASSIQAMAQMFGFATMDETQKYWVSNEIYQKSSDLDKDVKAWYKDFQRAITRDGISKDEIDYTLKTYNEAFRFFGEDNIRARDILRSLIEKDLRENGDRLFKQVIDSANWMDKNARDTLVKALPEKDAKSREQTKKIYDFIDSYRDSE